jgi:hypothetical protein
MPDWASAAFAEHEARYRAQIMADTWGHLDAQPGTTHSGYVVYAYTAWGQAEVIEAEFDGVAGGPAFYEHVNEFAYEQTEATKVPGVWRWNGTYRVGRRGTAYFKGKRSVIWRPRA